MPTDGEIFNGFIWDAGSNAWVLEAIPDVVPGSYEPTIASGDPNYFWAGDKTWKPVADIPTTITNLDCGIFVGTSGGTPVPPNPGSGFVWAGLATVWPTAATTGPRIARTAWGASNTISMAQTITGRTFTGRVTCTVHDVQFVDCQFNGGGINASNLRVKINYCRIVGTGSASVDDPYGVAGICTELTYTDISKHSDAVKCDGSNCLIQGNYFHDYASPTAAHNDGIQIGGSNNNITIKENYISWLGNNSAVFVKPEAGETGSNNVIVKNNFLDGGAYCMYFDNHLGRGMTGCQLVQNAFGTNYDYAGPIGIDGATITQSGNIDAAGNPVTG